MHGRLRKRPGRKLLLNAHAAYFKHMTHMRMSAGCHVMSLHTSTLALCHVIHLYAHLDASTIPYAHLDLDCCHHQRWIDVISITS